VVAGDTRVFRLLPIPEPLMNSLSRAANALTVLLALACFALAAFSCDRADATPRRDPGAFRAAVTIAPLKGLVEPLLPQPHQIYILIPPGRSEHGYEFTPSDVSALSKADLAVYIGLGLEPRIERFLSLNATPLREVVSFAQAVGVEEPGSAHHHHAHDENCDHGDDDPHVWLDPVLCAELIPVLRKALEQNLEKQGALNAAERERLARAEQSLVAQILELHEWAEKKLAPHAGKAIVTHHAAWGRLADRYGLKVAAVIRPIDTAEPTPRAIASAVEAIRQQDVRAIFIEPQFNPAAAERIAQSAGVHVAMLDPLGDGDWFKMMRANIESLAEALAR
jgi:zinc transport system substrate-binding protein